MKKKTIATILTSLTLVAISTVVLVELSLEEQAQYQREQELKQAEKERIEKIIYEQNKEAFEKMKQQVEDQKEQDRLDRLEELYQAEIKRLEEERLDSRSVLYVSSKNGLNVRTEPNSKADKLKTLPLNTKLITYRVENNKEWKQIEIDKVWYYVDSSYLSKEKTIIKPTVHTHHSTSGTTTISTPTNSGNLIGTYQLTAYCNCSKCCGQWAGGACADGSMPRVGVTVACNSIPLGTSIYIEGIGNRIVNDTGGMANNVIDLYFGSHEQALAFGRKHGVKVYKR